MNPNNGFGNFEQGRATMKNSISSIKSFVEVIVESYGVIRQGLLVCCSPAVCPSQLVGQQRGEIFNPNVELLYNGPRFVVSMSFTFVPKNEDEVKSK